MFNLQRMLPKILQKLRTSCSAKVDVTTTDLLLITSSFYIVFDNNYLTFSSTYVHIFKILHSVFLPTFEEKLQTIDYIFIVRAFNFLF